MQKKKIFYQNQKEKRLRHAIEIMEKSATMTDKETTHEKSQRETEKKDT